MAINANEALLLLCGPVARRPQTSCWSMTQGLGTPNLKHYFLFLVVAAKIKIVESVESGVNKP